jgi:diphthine synthase
VRVRALGEIVFVGLGLHDEMGISLRGLEEIKTADNVFIELYTNLMADFSKENLEKISSKELQIVSREELEERSGKLILETAETGKVVLLVPGDPLIATTHVALRIHAKKLGIKTRIVHGASILSAVIGLSGLHNYKFGKSVTIPILSENPSETPYEVIAQNKKRGLHTLCLLDVKVEENRYMKICEGLESLLKVEEKRKENIVVIDTLVVGIARAGSNYPTVRAGFLEDLLGYDFGGPPHSIVFPGELHFMEAEALIVLAGAPDSLRENG